MRAEAGTTIGGYELVRRIGKGGMAEVWVAQRAMGRKGSKSVAIKLIVDHYVGDERYTRMFQAEAELASSLSHANIVQVFDHGEEHGRNYLVMEWVDGLNLLKLGGVLRLLDDDDRRFRVTAYIIGQLLYALGYAHSITSIDGSPLGVVHRDVSPQNVLVSNHGEVKLTDFGVAGSAMEESSGLHVKGKVRYMAPEQMAGKTRSPTIDLYAIGALLHELLDGRKFREQYEGGRELFDAVLAGTVPPLSRPVPPELDELRLRLLAADPAERIQSADDAVNWLKRYPRYGDARGELTKLCGSLTGVVRPRVGPGQSSQVPAAVRLARPRVNLGAAQAAPVAAPIPLPRAASTPSGARALGHAATAIDNGHAGPPPPPSIARPTSTPRGPTPNRAPAAGAASPRGYGTAMPVHAAAAAAVARPAASPQYVASQPSSPIPHHVSPSPSYPIVPQPSSASQPPLYAVPPVASPGGAMAGGTEVLDPRSVAEFRASLDPQPALIPHDGTDTSCDAPSQTHPISIAVRRQSAVAMLSIVLVLVAVLSVSITWWLFTRNNEPASSEDTNAAVVTTPDEEEEPVAPIPEAVKLLEPEPAAAPAAVPESADEEPEGLVVLDDPTTPPNVENEDHPPELDPAPSPSETKGASPPPKKPRRPAKAMLQLTVFPGLEGSKIKVGSEVYTIPDTRRLKVKVSPGRKKTQWKKPRQSAWQSGPTIDLKSRKSTKLLLMAGGLRLQ